ncbi:putative defense protein 1 [Daphnia pulex]|uniref:putative defense protein 1 n=1 Tax=Daphnia pulex TaxID=6669 RepID=UPI001EDFAE04|nr:putative defense protein 1 [Daphnia pulex]
MSYCYYFLLAFVVARALASPYGAPLAACSSMTPLHGFDPQTDVESPFIILPLMNEIMQGTIVNLALSTMTDDYFKGFLVMAFDNYGETIGTFSVDEYGHLMSCPLVPTEEIMQLPI